jgi:hypothetical protein
MLVVPEVVNGIGHFKVKSFSRYNILLVGKDMDVSNITLRNSPFDSCVLIVNYGMSKLVIGHGH